MDHFVFLSIFDCFLVGLIETGGRTLKKTRTDIEKRGRTLKNTRSDGRTDGRTREILYTAVGGSYFGDDPFGAFFGFRFNHVSP